MQTKQFLAILGSTLLFIGAFLPVRSVWFLSDKSFFEISGGAGAFILLLAIASFILGLANEFIPLLFTGLVSGLTILFALSLPNDGFLPYDEFEWGLPVLLLGVGFLFVSGIINLIELNDEKEVPSIPASSPQPKTPVVEPTVAVEPSTPAPPHPEIQRNPPNEKKEEKTSLLPNWAALILTSCFILGILGTIFLSFKNLGQQNSYQPNSQMEKQEQTSEKAKKSPPKSRDTFNQGSSSITNSLGTRSRKEYADYLQRELVSNGYLVSVYVADHADGTLVILCKTCQAKEIAEDSGLLAVWMRLGFRRVTLYDPYEGVRKITLN